MKPITKMMIGTAAFLAAAATGSAQSMKAEIPFVFQVGQERLQPGSYRVRLNHNPSGMVTLQIYSSDSRSSAMTVARSEDRFARAEANGPNAVLSFECTDGRCALARVWDGSTAVYTFATGKPGAATRVATIVVRPDRGE